MDGIEVYLRRSGDRNLLMFHVPGRLRSRFQQVMEEASMIDGHQMPIAFEAPVLPEWTPDLNEPRHMRMAIDGITVQFDDD